MAPGAGMLLIGTPCYAGTVSVPYLTSLLATIRHCEQDGIEVELQHLAGESLLPRARNLIANAFFRRQEFSHLLLIDPDLGFPADAAVRYLRSGRDVVCGLPPLPRLDVDRLRALARNIPDEDAVAASLPYPFAPRPGAVPDESGLLPVAYGPAAFMMISRQALRRMAEAYPALRYRRSYVDSGDAPYKKWAFFDPVIDSQARESLPEDYAFCRRWTVLGGEIHADVTGTFTRSGAYAYTGDYRTWLTVAAGRPAGGGPLFDGQRPGM